MAGQLIETFNFVRTGPKAKPWLIAPGKEVCISNQEHLHLRPSYLHLVENCI